MMCQEARAVTAKIKRDVDAMKQQNDALQNEIKSLLVESKRAQEFAKRSFRIDEYGNVWRWDVDKKKYIMTDVRICKPFIPVPGSSAEKLPKEVNEKLTKIFNDLLLFTNRIEKAEYEIAELQEHPSDNCDCPHIIQLTQEEYDALQQYERGTIYFIVEKDINPFWRIGDPLPMVIGGYGLAIGDPLPIIVGGKEYL